MPKRKKEDSNNQKPKCVDLFCGCGGLSLGVKNAGFEIIAAFDNDKSCLETYNRNFSSSSKTEIAHQVDLSSFSVKNLLSSIGMQRGELDLLVAGPSCQGFSMQNKQHHASDERNMLVNEVVKFVKGVNPKVFLMENVAAIASRGKLYIDYLYSSLKGYRITGQLYCAADYGVSQTRERFIIVGIRKDLGVLFHPPQPTHSQEEWQTVRDAFGDLPSPPKDGTSHPDFANHCQAMITEETRKRFSYVKPGGGWEDIPKHLLYDCHKASAKKKKNGKTNAGFWPDVFGRLCWDKPASTITGGCISFTKGRFGHPSEHRTITPREAARCQSFPDDFEFCGSKKSICNQIGNAVPPLLAFAIASAIMEILQQKVIVEKIEEESEEEEEVDQNVNKEPCYFDEIDDSEDEKQEQKQEQEEESQKPKVQKKKVEKRIVFVKRIKKPKTK